MDRDLSELSKALTFIKEIGSKYAYNKICKMDEDTLENYRTLLNELTELNSYTGKEYDKLRGKKLEELVTVLLESSGGIFKVMQNIRTSTNEIDQVITLSQTGKILKNNGIINNKFDLFLGECKNYNRKLNVTYVGKFCSLLLTSNIKLGIIFSIKGLSGKGWKDSHGLIKKFYMTKENENNRFCIIDFSYEDFVSIAEGNNFLQIVDDKLKELRIDTSYAHLISKHEAEDKILNS